MNEETAELQPHATVRGVSMESHSVDERTRLAKERTQLAYIRTGISLLLGGLFFIGYFQPDTVFSYAGYATILVSLMFLVYGFRNHNKSKVVVNKVIHTLTEDEKF